MKKFFAILLSIVLMLSLTVPAMAEEETTYKITVPTDDTHTYEVYQIFTGDYYEGVLSNLVWGKNGSGYVAGAEKQEKVPADVLTALQAVTNSTSDSAKLAVIEDYVNLTSEKYGTVRKEEPLSVEPGYYLLKDANNSLTGADDAYTTYIVQIVDNVTVTRKAAKPTVDKQVWDEAADGEANGQEWGETADHEINETFQFKLIATITGNTDYNAYETYKLIFHDTWSEGVTYIGNEKVTIVSGSNTIELAEGQYSAIADEENRTLTITITDIKSIDNVDLTKNTSVTVIYDAKLNEKAVVNNVDENLNTVYLEYSNNPNWNGTGTEETGKTEEDTVWVFTYQVDVTKVDGADDSKYLEGAEFKMKNAEGEWLFVNTEDKVQNWVTDETQATVLKSDAEGKFSVIGLDAGTYYLKEIKAPAGYNLLSEEITVTIEAAHKETVVDAAETVFTEDSKTEITVENNAGATLPETGGMGTTIFYIVGGIMVAAAVVLLITKKRMSAEG